MSIPRGLILYKSARYQESFPVNIKYGYYSDKILSSSSTQKGYKIAENCYHRYQKKLTQEIQFHFQRDSPREIETIRRFSKFQNVKTCKIELAFSSQLSQGFKYFQGMMIEIIPILLKTLKNLRNVTINPSSELFKTSRVSKSLLLAKNLESLTLLGFNYSVSSNSSQAFLQSKEFHEENPGLISSP